MPAMLALRRPSLFAIACIAVLLAAVPPVFAQAGVAAVKTSIVGSGSVQRR